MKTLECRCRLAVWRQLPKLIPASSTLVTCSTKKAPFWGFFLFYDKFAINLNVVLYRIELE